MPAAFAWALPDWALPDWAPLDWALLDAEMARWARAGRRPQFWWRDDDASDLTPSLVRLIDLAAEAGAPLSLAIIPAVVTPGLAVFINRQPTINVLQHGTDHANRGPADQAGQFGAQDGVAAVTQALTEGWARLEGFSRRLPVYVPPWNAVTANLEAALPRAGLTALSAWSGLRRPGRLDAHLDLMRWKPDARFAGRRLFLARLRRCLAQRRKEGLWDEPIGLLTHHLDHDAEAWAFIRRFLGHPSLRAGADWLAIEVLLQP